MTLTTLLILLLSASSLCAGDYWGSGSGGSGSHRKIRLSDVQVTAVLYAVTWR